VRLVGSCYTDFKWSSDVSIDKPNYSDDNKPTSRVLKSDMQNERACHIFMTEMLPTNASGLKLQLGPSNRKGCTIPDRQDQPTFTLPSVSVKMIRPAWWTLLTSENSICGLLFAVHPWVVMPGMVIIYCHFNDQLSARSLGQPYLQECVPSRVEKLEQELIISWPFVHIWPADRHTLSDKSIC